MIGVSAILELRRSVYDDFSLTPHRKEIAMQKYVCNICGCVYDPAQGDPSGDIAPGTAFEEVPDSWVCPDCGVKKSDFSPVE